MYLSQAVIENSGSLKWLNLKLPFQPGGLPKPLLIVGQNGSGKTNFLSQIADALFEAAAAHYDNVLPAMGAGRAWFRVVGGRTISVGQRGSFSILKFSDGATDRVYKEKAGFVPPEEAKLRLPTNFAPYVNWNSEGSFKEFAINEADSEKMFNSGVYVYFPSSRSESPYWLNKEALPNTEFDMGIQFSKRLQKPIYVEQALGQFKQWVAGLIADTRTEIEQASSDTASAQWHVVGDPRVAMACAPALEICNRVIQLILGDPNARFVWLGRKSPDKISVASGNALILPNLDALSAGQAIALGMFGSILRYGDMSQDTVNLNLSNVRGICIIDEIDAHMHVEIQHKVLPELVAMFPSVQFIITTHSPIFILGMESSFGTDNIQIIELPSGNPVTSETYKEFEDAMHALTASQTFTEMLVAESKKSNRPIIYVEGETDAPYLKRAAELHGRCSLLEACDIEWIGGRDDSGQGFHTGKDALRHTLAVFRANPDLANRRILLLHDNDSTAPDSNFGQIMVRKLPKNPGNSKIRCGIENLLAEEAIEDKFYQEKTKTKDNGDVHTTRSLRKSELCKYLSEHGTAEQFANFASALDIIGQFIAHDQP